MPMQWPDRRKVMCQNAMTPRRGPCQPAEAGVGRSGKEIRSGTIPTRITWGGIGAAATMWMQC